MSHLDSLPEDLVIEVSSYLNHKDLHAISKLINITDSMYRKLFCKYFNIHELKFHFFRKDSWKLIIDDIDWNIVYKEVLRIQNFTIIDLKSERVTEFNGCTTNVSGELSTVLLLLTAHDILNNYFEPAVEFFLREIEERGKDMVMFDGLMVKNLSYYGDIVKYYKYLDLDSLVEKDMIIYINSYTINRLENVTAFLHLVNKLISINMVLITPLELFLEEYFDKEELIKLNEYCTNESLLQVVTVIQKIKSTYTLCITDVI